MQNKSRKGRVISKPPNYEEVYQHINQKKWSSLIQLANDCSSAIASDEMLESAFKVFESEFIRNLDDSGRDQEIIKNLSQLYIIHTTKVFLLQDKHFRKICIELAKASSKKGADEAAYNYAKNFPEDEICAGIIKKYNDSLPKVVEHTQSKNIRITENKDISSSKYVISLFKSKQEQDFFMAVREVFPLYTVYPNVAVSCLIDFEKIKASLSDEEKSYFFVSIVDCVVFDHHKNYIPIYFFELDSFWHDTQAQKMKDDIKDKIFALAGLKLYRIRKMSQAQEKNEFITLIRDVFEK